MKPSEEDERTPARLPEEPLELDPTIHLAGSEDRTLSTDPEGDPTLPLERGGDDTQGVPSTAARSLPAGGAASHVFANRFEVVQLLGEGGMGRVYLVRDRQIEGRQVALKVLRPRFSQNARFRELFFQEIRAAQKFVSENVNQVRDTGQMDDGRLFLTMDLVDGESLQQLIRRESKLNTRHALEITRQMLLGLQSGHEQGFVHRDVKPSNVMLATRVSKTDENPYGVGVRLLDFGIAALAADIGEGAVSGTPMYMSPEQTQGQRLDPRSDLFSVGIVLYEMLSGSRPFEGSTLEEVSTSLVETQVAPKIKGLEHLKPSVQKLLRKALEKDREKRFQNASEFIDAIERSKAYRLPTGVPGWVGGLLGLALVAAGGEAYVIFDQFDEMSRVRTETEASKNAALFAEKRSFDDIAAKLREQLAQKDNELAQKDTRLNELALQLGAKGDEQVVVQTDEKLRDARIQSLEEARAQEQRKREQLEVQIAQLQEKLRIQDRVSTPPAQAAELMDRVLEFIEGAHGSAAVARFEQEERNQLFARSGIGGKEFIAELTHAAADLHGFQASKKSNELRRELLASARVSASNAEAKLASFEIGAKAWLDFRLDPSSDIDYDRLGRVKAVLESTRAAIETETEELRRADRERVQSLVEGPPDQDPERVIRYGEDYGWTDLAPFFERLVSHFEPCVSGGRPNLGALRKNHVLGRWGAYADLHRDVPDPAINQPIRWFGYARKWYVDQSGAGFTPDLAELRLGESAPDWRAVLALQHGIAAGLERAMLRPRTYLDRQLKSQVTSWIVDSNSTVDKQDGVVWTVRRKTLTERAGDLDPFEDTLRITFKDGVLLGNDKNRRLNVFDPDARVEFWQPALDRPVARNRSLPRQEDVDSFRNRFADAPIPCLVVEDPSTDTIRFVSPDFGLVREERRGVFLLELVFAGE